MVKFNRFLIADALIYKHHDKGMATLRSAIDLLAKILRSNGATYLKAETFRLAKFNRGEASAALWRLLFELVCYSEFGEISDSVLKAYDRLSSDEVISYVKQELERKGYYSPDFAKLSADVQEGSRELLLAFGWLLSNDKIIEKFATRRTAVLDDDTADIYKEEMINSKPNNALSLSSLPGNTDSRVKQLLWLNNKLRLNLCSLYSLQCQRSRMKHKIQEATFGAKTFGANSHMSMFEVYLIRNPELLRKNIDLLEKDSERLHDLLKWRDYEGIFWKWMESVLDEKLHPKDDAAQATDVLRSNSEDITAVAARRLHESHQTLQEAIIKYDAVLEHLEKLCLEKSCEVSSEMLDRIAADIELELSKQKANLAVQHHDKISVMSKEPRFILETKQKGSKPRQTESQLSFASLLSNDWNDNPITDVADEIDRLQRHLLRLEKDLGTEQAHFKTHIERLSEKLPNAVCIPPLNRNLKIHENV